MQMHLSKKRAQELIIPKPFVHIAEREGFEPSLRFRKHAFQACAFNHSATSPKYLKIRAAKVMIHWLISTRANGRVNSHSLLYIIVPPLNISQLIVEYA